jgi:hypothetical protein
VVHEDVRIARAEDDLSTVDGCDARKSSPRCKKGQGERPPGPLAHEDAVLEAVLAVLQALLQAAAVQANGSVLSSTALLRTKTQVAPPMRETCQAPEAGTP